MDPVSDNDVRDWLLRRLEPARAEALEQQLLTDDELAPRLRAAEVDLLDDFAQGRLDPGERAEVARLLATPADRDRLRIAAALARVGREHPRGAMVDGSLADRGSRSSRIAWGSAIAACLLVAIGSLFLVRRESAAPETAPLPSITLIASAQRGTSEDVIALPAQGGRVRLQLEVDAPKDAPATRYDVAVADAERVLFQAHDVALYTAGPYRFVEVTLPTQDLGPGRRRITLSPSADASAAVHWDITTR